MTERIRFSIHRALADARVEHYARTKGVDQEGAGAKQPSLPGLVGMTKYQLMIEADERIARALVEICDEQLRREDLHEAKRDAIEYSRKNIIDRFPNAA